jgi:hypothetical protein
MGQVLGVAFAALSVVLSICVVYCLWMALTVGAGWFFVGVGVLLSDIVAIAVTMMLLGE